MAAALTEVWELRYKARVFREGDVWASRTLRVEGGVGVVKEVLRHSAYPVPAQATPGSVLGRVGDSWHCLPVWRGSEAAQLSRNGSGGKGGHPPLAFLTSHLLVRAAECLMTPPMSSSEDMEEVGTEGHAGCNREQQRWGLHSQPAFARFCLCLCIRPRYWL